MSRRQPLQWLGVAACLASIGAQQAASPPAVLPAPATAALDASLAAAGRHVHHVWRDRVPVNGDGTVNAYIEIARGDRRKWEFDMGEHRRAIDRMIPAAVGGYPVNYGFVPQTVSYDGDPFDALVLGPPIQGGSMVRGVIVGFMMMEDEKGLDSKVVLSPSGRDGRPTHQLTSAIRQQIGDYFERYKRHEPGAFSRVPGWGTPEDGLAFIEITHLFFRECRQQTGRSCQVKS